MTILQFIFYKAFILNTGQNENTERTFLFYISAKKFNEFSQSKELFIYL